MRLRRSGVKVVVQIARVDCGQDCGQDCGEVVVGAVVDGAGEGGALDVVFVAVVVVEDGRVEGLGYLADVCAVE